jgi:hypothetical protein
MGKEGDVTAAVGEGIELLLISGSSSCGWPNRVFLAAGCCEVAGGGGGGGTETAEEVIGKAGCGGRGVEKFAVAVSTGEAAISMVFIPSVIPKQQHFQFISQIRGFIHTC